ncbi:MAG: glycosyltransferase family 4 protein [Planctomycetota bacterium]|jgi:glycosyltransferase involved in cell wall biosynthesis
MNDKIRICFIAPKAYPLFDPETKGVFGGAEVDLYILAVELAKDDKFTVSFVTADYGQEQDKVLNGVRIIKSLDFRTNPLSGAVKVWRAMNLADTQIYFQEAASWGTFLVALFCKLNKKIFIYRTAHKREVDGTYIKKHFWAGKAFRWSLRQAAQTIVQNETDKSDLLRMIGVKSTVIPNAHHLTLTSEQEKDIILWVGRSAKVKKPELFLQLAEMFPSEHFVQICPQATGDDKYDVLTDKANQVKNLEFIRRVEFNDIDKYFLRAKVFVSTSDAEGFPNTFVQACKHSTPILSLRVNPDDFLNRYKSGQCANGNWDTFVALLKQMLKPEEIDRYGKNARKYAEQHHDIKKIVEDYKIIFSSK